MKVALFLKKYFGIILLAITAVLITVSAVAYKQNPFFAIPIYVSLFVGLLQSGANRYSMLIGGFNSILYTVVYLMLGLYATAAQALFFSCFFQFAGFISWNRRKYGTSTVFRRLSNRMRAVLALALTAGFAILCAVLNMVGSSYTVLDSLSFFLGSTISVLTLFAYVEYSWLMLPSGIISIMLNLQTLQASPGQLSYVIFSIYSMICVTMGFFSVRNLWKQQNQE